MVIHSLIIAMIILFLHATTWKDHIFEGIKRLVPPDFALSKPLYGCPICMTPWWGSLFYWVFWNVGPNDWVLTVGTAAGFSVLSVVAVDIRDACVQLTKRLEAKNEEEGIIEKKEDIL